MKKQTAKNQRTGDTVPVADRPTTIKGLVEIIHFASGTFTAGKLRPVGNGDGNSSSTSTPTSLISFTAPQELKLNSQITLHGRWEEHKLYGAQFKATQVEYDLALDAAGLSLWLQKNNEIRGIGPSKAQTIANAFGERFDDVIRNNPDEVARVAKLSPEAISNLRTIWIKNQAEIHLITWLAAFGLSIHEIETLRNKYGYNTVGVLRKDPYLIIGELPGFAFKKVDKIALKTGIPKDAVSRIDHGILWCIRDAEDSGHTYVTLGELIENANTLLELDGLGSRVLISERCQDLLRNDRLQIIHMAGQPGDHENEVFACLRPVTWRREVWMQETVCKCVEKGERILKRDDLDEFRKIIQKIAPSLNSQQLEAVLNATIYQLSLISGGAGTGKTFTVDAIRRYWLQNGHTVMLCAPTGKAARRLEEVTGHEASTIHRLLGYNGIDFTAGPDSPIPTDVLIIDEFSMVDSTLAYHLFRAIDWQRTTVVLVGDHNQLPPVGPGNMLRDLIEHSSVPTTILDTVVRQAGILKTNSCRILTGSIERSEGSSWQIVDSLGDAESCRLWVEEIFANILQGYPDLDVTHGLQILAPMKDREVGVKRLNIELQRIYQQVRHKVVVESVAEGRRPKFYRHDKVIQTKNDYSLGVMNGTLGQVIGVEPGGSILINFEGQGEVVEVPSHKKINLQLAYALTIHKCQGSEFPFVILVVHKSQSFMHSRNLIYTGATRAKRKLIIVGDQWGIRNSVMRVDADKRKTWFGELLRKDREWRERMALCKPVV